MPNRIIREGIINSDRVNQLDWPAECFYRRLMSKVDDHGLFDARPSILRAALYPLKLDRVREADIPRWLAECQKAGLIVLYEAGGKQYGKMLNTQWTARSEPKFPLPPKEVLQTLANNCAQMRPQSLSESLSESLSKSLSKSESTVGLPPLGLELAKRLGERLKANDPQAKIPADLMEWAMEADRLVRLDGREKAEIERVMDWCQADDFWKANILSMSKFRKKYQTLRLQMERKGSNGGRRETIAGYAAPDDKKPYPC